MKNKKKLSTLRVTVTAQTAYHLHRMAEVEGCSLGRVIDKLTRAHQASLEIEPKGGKHP